MPKTRSLRTCLTTFLGLFAFLVFLAVWLEIGYLMLWFTGPIGIDSRGDVVGFGIIGFIGFGAVVIVLYGVVRPLWRLFALFFLPARTVPASLLHFEEAHQENAFTTYTALFESRGKRLRLKIPPAQGKWLVMHSAPGDPGLLTYRGKWLRYWKNNPATVRAAGNINLFLSYSRAWIEDADYLRQFFESKGIRVWKDDKRLEIGSSLTREITDAIASTTYFVPLLSPEYWSSEWCVKEFDTAIEYEKHILPIKVSAGKINLPPHLNSRFRDRLDDTLHLDLRGRNPLPRLNALTKQMVNRVR